MGAIFKFLLLAGFLFHTLGLAIRWYISGHAPMSNGYETMIFISWVTILAGFIFSRRSLFVLAATAVLGGFTLLVAHLSFMDPEITNLVPVLQSYWLTLHVSVITSSYGFLGLGAIIGVIVLIIYSFIIHSKNIVGLRGLFAFNAMALFGFSSVLMTYFGVNYYLSGLHSYAGGDPVPVPKFVYISVIVLVLLSVFAFIRHRKYDLS